MKKLNEMKVTFQSRSVNERFARSVVAAFVAALDPNVDELTDIRTVVSEAVTNCVVHAYRDKIDNIYITASIFENGRVMIKIRDRGCGIEDIDRAMEPLYTSRPAEERAGLGFAVMQSLCDRVRVSSRVGYGTTVTLIKTIAAKEA